MTKAERHRWQLQGALDETPLAGVRKPAIQRVREAVSEIKRIRRTGPVLAAEGAVLFLEKVSPALEHVDSSSGAIGTAVNRAIEELVPVIAQAPVEHFRRAEWLQRLWQAYTTDSIKREDNAMEFTTKHTTAPVLSHVEAIYRPGDRQLVIDLFEALGCKTYDTGTKSPAGSTYISVHPDPDVRCQDDVIYLSEMPAEQRRLEDVLRRRIEADEELRAARDLYRGMANERPFGLSHVAVRYPSFESLERVLDGLEDRLTPELKSRVMLKIFRPGDSDEIGVDNSIQAFVYTDLAVSGISAFGQVFELAAYE